MKPFTLEELYFAWDGHDVEWELLRDLSHPDIKMFYRNNPYVLSSSCLILLSFLFFSFLLLFVNLLTLLFIFMILILTLMQEYA